MSKQPINLLSHKDIRILIKLIDEKIQDMAVASNLYLHCGLDVPHTRGAAYETGELKRIKTLCTLMLENKITYPVQEMFPMEEV